MPRLISARALGGRVREGGRCSARALGGRGREGGRCSAGALGGRGSLGVGGGKEEDAVLVCPLK